MELLAVLVMLYLTLTVIGIGLRFGGGAMWRQSPEAIRLAHKTFEESGYSWDRVRRASTYRNGVYHLSRAKLRRLVEEETK